MEQIGDERISLAQISLMAGFAETNGLARAMRSWTGFSPSQYRKITLRTAWTPRPILTADALPKSLK
jgi:AraC-like DNA-binding protein